MIADSIFFVVIFLIFAACVVYLFLRIKGVGRSNSDKEAKNTICPKCSYHHNRIFHSHYKCKKCGAEFKVDKLGNADLPPKNKIFVGLIFGILWTAFFILILNYYADLEIIDKIKLYVFGSFGPLFIAVSIYKLILHQIRY